MKQLSILLFAAGLTSMLASFTPATKLTSSKIHIKFFSATPVEDIEANNYTAVSTINPATGEVVFSVPMQAFEFEKALMQKHFNGKDFLDTKAFPKAKLTGTITNLQSINFDQDGTYTADIKGELTIKGVTNSISEKGTILIKGSTVQVSSKFNVTLADFGIAFEKGKPSTNVAKTIEVTVNAEYQSQ